MTKFLKNHKKAMRYGILSGIVVGALVAIIYSNFVNTKTLPETIVENDSSSEPAIAPITKIELPFGGRTLEQFRFVALYGSPLTHRLGSLGEQSIPDAIVRASSITATYQSLSTEKVIPTFEIIVTVASAGPTENDDYSNELAVDMIRPWVDAAKAAGVYVVLDFQPGRAKFVDQIKLYENLLVEPHVGVALDPEWRLLTPEARHLKKVGSVSAAEVNEASAWVADFVKSNDLPQKIFMVHQFMPSMVAQRETLITTALELRYILHVDGFGTIPAKVETWNRIKAGMPENVGLGWKNFFDEDKPMPTPEQTMTQTPKPTFISFQ
jgi:hypothetical protein